MRVCESVLKLFRVVKREIPVFLEGKQYRFFLFFSAFSKEITPVELLRVPEIFKKPVCNSPIAACC